MVAVTTVLHIILSYRLSLSLSQLQYDMRSEEIKRRGERHHIKKVLSELSSHVSFSFFKNTHNNTTTCTQHTTYTVYHIYTLLLFLFHLKQQLLPVLHVFTVSVPGGRGHFMQKNAPPLVYVPSGHGIGSAVAHGQ